MLRILHSLPRAHKLLLLPVATMVTVLGAQQIFTVIDSRDESPQITRVISLEESADSAGVTFPDAQGGDDAWHRDTPAQERLLALATPFPAADSAASRPGLSPEALRVALGLTALRTGEWEEATSYDDFDDGPLALFDSENIYLEDEIQAEEVFEPRWETYTVQAGDTFAVLAQSHLGMGYSEALRLLESLPDENVLTRWRVGQSFDYMLDEEGRLQALKVMVNARRGYLVERQEDAEVAFATADIERAGEATQRLFAGSVSGSLARSAQATGLNASEVAQLTNVLSKKLDFRRDTRRGDRFQVLVESDMIDGQPLDSRILAVQYEGERMDLAVFRNSADDRFYTADGRGLDPAFERYPFNGNYRLSSSFNRRRTHPVTGRVSPHYGTDFAMPTGTPVISPADGRVERVGNHSAAGRYVVIRHDNGYRTRYLHLSRPQVSRGDRVSMGEQIALSGNTGRSTGPHLHYEVIVNNQPVDAMRVELPESQRLEGDALAAFQQESEQLLARLESGETGTVLASTPREPRPDSDS
ncbi:peptidoglycan DD-metalloendopeptidase family protein [Halomonas pacifica]|nr:peptidoglycan DD-metalloendopeptidase family protein [Halomonas pacifica]MDC8802324.1 peptidoglycan DD-metalloendopeptidase family protein [Halomonas pacifica]